MQNENEIPEEMLKLLERYGAGRIPPFIDTESSAGGLIDRDWFEIYQAGFQHKLFGALGVQLAADQYSSLEDKWNKAKNLHLKTTQDAWIGFCAALRGKEAGNEACILCDRYWARRAAEEDRVISYMCVHGLIEFAVPIKVNDEIIAVVFTGQLFPRPRTSWNPEIIEPGGLFRPLQPQEKGVEAWKESRVRIERAEQTYGFSEQELLDALYSDTEMEVAPQDVEAKLDLLTHLGKHLSQLATAQLESEKGKIHAWIRNGISYSLAQLAVEVSTDTTSTGFKGVVASSVIRVWQEMANYLKYIAYYFGFAHLVVISCEYRNHSGIINLLSYYGQSSKDFPFPGQYDCAEWHTSLQSLCSEMPDWRTATEIDLTRYASLPIIEGLHKLLRRHRPVPTYAVSSQAVSGVPPILVLGSLDYRRRVVPLSPSELDEFTTFANEIGLVANTGNLVVRLGEAAEQQARFIENVAHDIRNPIQNLIAMARYMEIEDIPIETQKKTAKDIAAEVRRINELSGRVWVLEDLRRGIIDLGKPHNVAVFDTIMRCQKSLRHRATQNNIRLEIKNQEELKKWNIRVNEELFYHTMLNLMDNAIKYSVPDTEVRIEGITKPDEYILTIGNIGIGVPEDEKEFIFQRHYRAKNAERKIREGTGIGLSIVKAFADRYGSIEVQSNPLENSDLHLTIFYLTIRRE